MKVNINTSTKVTLLFCGVLLSGSVFAENVIPKGASNLPSLKFGALVKTYMIDESSKKTWNFSTNSQNILWNSNIKWNAQNKRYEKEGFVRLQFDGFKLKESPHTNSKTAKLRPEAAWNINYSGKNKSEVNRISLEHLRGGLISAYDEPKIKPLKSLVRHNITYKPLCFYKHGSNEITTYKLTNSNKTIYMTIGEFGGSGGYSKSFNLFLKKSDMLDYFYYLTDTDDDSSNCTSF